MISPATIARLREAVDLQALAADYVTLIKAGSGYVSKCPFHEEKTASCRIHKDRFFCFGCNAHGSAFDWLMLLDGCSFVEAAHRLSDISGIPLDSKPVSRAAMQYDREERELCKWWWVRYKGKLRADLDKLLGNNPDFVPSQSSTPSFKSVIEWYMSLPGIMYPEIASDSLLEAAGRAWRWDPGPSGIMKFYRQQCSAYERWLWREEREWDKRLEQSWCEAVATLR